MGYQICEKCGSRNREDASFCQECGANLSFSPNHDDFEIIRPASNIKKGRRKPITKKQPDKPPKKMKNLYIALLILLILFSGFFLYMYAKGVNLGTGQANVIIFCVDPTEWNSTSGSSVGGIDALVLLKTNNWQIESIEPLWPGHIYHPTAKPPKDLQAHLRKYNLDPTHYYLHDSYWEGDIQKGSKLATESLENNTKIKANFVVIINPEAVDSIIRAVGPVYVKGEGTVSGNSAEILRDQFRGQGKSRSESLGSLFNALKAKSMEPSNYPSIFLAILIELIKGNIKIVL